ncbi:MAG: DNA-binding protein [Chloroflexi bacterium]|nr:DNA-binding protein [Chloroflexota bacterium]
MDRRQLQQLAILRVQEDLALLDSGFYSGAYYLLGYAVECALKACIARNLKRHEFPERRLVSDFYTHDLERLLVAAGLKEDLERSLAVNQRLRANWFIIKAWSEQARYDSTISSGRATDLYDAITERSNGVLTWLKKWW